MSENTLAAALKWPNGLPPIHSTTLITDSLSSPGQFLISSLVASSLKSSPQARTVLIGFSQIFNHYNHIAVKLGINLGAAKANGQLAFIDGLTRIGDRLNTRKYSVIGSNAVQPDHQPSSTIKPFPIYNDTQATKTNNVDCNNDPSLEWINSLLEEIQGHLYVPNKTHDDPSVKNYLIIDDINIMLDVGVPLYAVQTFIQACQSMAAQNDGVLVILAHADEELREEYVEPFDDLASFLGNMYQLSDYVLQLDGLTTGYSHDVSGQLTAARGSLCKDSDFQPTVLHYSIQEKGTKFFAPGAAHDVL